MSRCSSQVLVPLLGTCLCHMTFSCFLTCTPSVIALNHCCMQVPIIAPVKAKKHERLLEEPLHTHYSNEFLTMLMGNAELVRHVAVVGALHHGKTTLMDMMIEQTHELDPALTRNKKQLRFTDTRLDEQVGRGWGSEGFLGGGGGIRGV